MPLGSIADWKELVGYYSDAENYTPKLAALEVEKYTTQLRALEKAAAQNPTSAAEHFLLGYHRRKASTIRSLSILSSNSSVSLPGNGAREAPASRRSLRRRFAADNEAPAGGKIRGNFGRCSPAAQFLPG